MDNFAEVMVKRSVSAKEKWLRILYFVIATALSIPVFMFGVFEIKALSFLKNLNFVFPLLFYYGAFYLSAKFNKEFEYTFVEGQIEIDQIISGKKRKNICKIMCKDMTFCKAYNGNVISENCKKINAYGDDLFGPVYLIRAYGMKQEYAILFQPNEKLLDLIYTYNKSLTKE